MIFLEVARVTLRALVGRRRSILMVLLVSLPVLVGLLVRVNSSGTGNVGTVLDGLIVRIVLPLVALVFGTAALGSELEDGTAIHLLTKPIRRSTIVLAKVLVAGTLTALLLVPSTAVSALLIGRTGVGADAALGLGVGVLVGSYVYVAVFAALSVVTSRGLIIGLGYALIWEGLLAGVLPGSQAFSVREYVRGIAELVSPGIVHSLVGSGGIVYAIVALVAAIVIGSVRLSAYEVRGAE